MSGVREVFCLEGNGSGAPPGLPGPTRQPGRDLPDFRPPGVVREAADRLGRLLYLISGRPVVRRRMNDVSAR